VIEDRDLNARLENWARVYRDRSCLRVSWLAKMIALYGAEGRGIANECEKDCNPVDVKDAALVERALCSPLYPERYRLMICVLYLRPWIPLGRIRRVMHMQRYAFDKELHAACVMLSNLLEFYARDKNIDFHDDEG
jgi:hypothetical protein